MLPQAMTNFHDLRLEIRHSIFGQLQPLTRLGAMSELVQVVTPPTSSEGWQKGRKRPLTRRTAGGVEG
jgi:hypothetical protein